MIKKDVYTTHEIAKIFGVHIMTVQRWSRDGKIEMYRTLGGHRRISRAGLIAFMKNSNLMIPEELKDAE